MARRLGPDENSRLAYHISGTQIRHDVGGAVTVYVDAACTTLADIATYDPANPTTPGSAITGSVVYVDSSSKLPLFWFPVDGTDTLWVQASYAGSPGPATRIVADLDARIDDEVSARGTALAAEASARTAGDAATLTSAQTYTDTAATAEATARVAGDALAALKANNLSDLASASSARTNLGLGGAAVLNVGTTAGTVAAGDDSRFGSGGAGALLASNNLSDLASAATARDNLHSISVVNVRDYGAVGDASYIDQCTVSNNFGLTAAVPLYSTFGKAFKDTAFTQPATDNTTAFQNAWDALMTSGQVAYERRGNPGSNGGWRAIRKEFYIPEGAYYISNASALFSLLRVSVAGQQRGVSIRGAGKGCTTIYVRITGSTSTDFLFYDSNSFHGMDIRDLSIVCTTGNERVFYQSSSGNASRYYLENMEIADYKACITIAGAANADRWTCIGCEVWTSVAQAVFYTNPSNTQAVAHEFFSLSLAHYNGGILWDVGVGTLHIWGGYTTMIGLAANGADGIIYRTGSTAPRFPNISVWAHRTELQQDSGLCDLSGGRLTFVESTPALVGNTRTSPHVVVRGIGAVEFRGGFVDDFLFASSTDMTTMYYTSERNEIIIKDAVVKNPNLMSSRYIRYTSAGDGLTTLLDLASVYTGSASIPRIYMNGCRTYSVTLSAGIFVAPNGAPFDTRGASTRSAPIQLARSIGASGHTHGLPSTTESHTIVIPLYCELRRITISKQDGTGAGTWQVADGDGNVLCTLTAGSSDNYVFSEANFRKVVTTTNQATFVNTCLSGNSAIGYFSVEYV